MAKKRTKHPRLSLVNKLFSYIPETGQLVRKVTVANNAKEGAIVGSDNGKGYLLVGIQGKNWFVHHIIWFMCKKIWPKVDLDHKDRNPSNNRLNNLRLSTRIQNMANQSLTSRNTSGFKGVYYAKKSAPEKRWAASININKKITYLGGYPTAIEAAKAYNIAALKEFGEFAWLNPIPKPKPKLNVVAALKELRKDDWFYQKYGMAA